jgi:hypothetical protein
MDVDHSQVETFFMHLHKVSTRDVRFQLAAGADSDAVHSAPEYSFAVTQLTSDTGLQGTGLVLIMSQGQIHQHLVLFNHIAPGNPEIFLEYIPHLNRYFLAPADVSAGRYRTPQEPGSSSDLL